MMKKMSRFKRTVGVNRQKKQLIGVKNKKGVYEATEIRSKKDRPLWKLFLEFFNSLEIGSKFTRVEMLSSVYEENIVLELRGYITSVDTYKSYLKRLGIIEYIAPGIYIKKFNLPDHITISQIKKAASIGDWKEWFIPLYEKLNIKESDLK